MDSVELCAGGAGCGGAGAAARVGYAGGDQCA